MLRFESPDASSATLHRRALLIAAAAAPFAACGRSHTMTVSTTPVLDMKTLEDRGAALSARAGDGVLGVGLMNLESGENWTLNGTRPFPMQGVFKAVLGAAVLSEIDAQRLRLDERFILTDEMLSPPWSPVADAWPARRDYTARDLLIAAVAGGDNTAADVLMKRIGGPGAVNGWLQGRRLADIRVDRYERELEVESVGLASFRAAWKGAGPFAEALAHVPGPVRKEAARRYLADPRDTATPGGMLDFLQMLHDGELISEASTRLLLQIMAATPHGTGRLKAALPAGATLAHMPAEDRPPGGTSPVVNDVGLVVLPDGRVYAMAVFLAGPRLDAARADALIAEVGRLLIRAAR